MLPRSARLLAAPVLAAALTVSGCASGEQPATTSAPVGSTSPDDETVEVDVTIRDGKVTPKPRRVEVPRGATVRLVVTSDVDDEIHVHGYDVAGEVEAGRPSATGFVADQSGLFEVETHETELALVQLEVR